MNNFVCSLKIRHFEYHSFHLHFVKKKKRVNTLFPRWQIFLEFKCVFFVHNFTIIVIQRFLFFLVEIVTFKAILKDEIILLSPQSLFDSVHYHKFHHYHAGFGPIWYSEERAIVITKHFHHHYIHLWLPVDSFWCSRKKVWR